MGEDRISLSEFQEAQISFLNEFVSLWITENQKDAEAYPLEMTLGEWDEQLRVYEEDA